MPWLLTKLQLGLEAKVVEVEIGPVARKVAASPASSAPQGAAATRSEVKTPIYRRPWPSHGILSGGMIKKEVGKRKTKGKGERGKEGKRRKESEMREREVRTGRSLPGPIASAGAILLKYFKRYAHAAVPFNYSISRWPALVSAGHAQPTSHRARSR